MLAALCFKALNQCGANYSLVTSAFLTQASLGCTMIIHLTIVWTWDFVAGIACSFPLEFIIAQWD
jgi:hypothetical protein